MMIGVYSAHTADGPISLGTAGYCHESASRQRNKGLTPSIDSAEKGCLPFAKKRTEYWMA